MPEIAAATTATETEEPRRRRKRRRGSSQVEKSGVWYPRWYWPSFVAPGAIWLIVLFVLPFYVVFAVAFGSINFDFFGTAVPYYAPWWWSFETFNKTLSKFYEPPHIYLDPLVRTFEYVMAASVIYTLPVIIVFIILRKHLMSGTTAGAVKG